MCGDGEREREFAVQSRSSHPMEGALLAEEAPAAEETKSADEALQAETELE